MFDEDNDTPVNNTLPSNQWNRRRHNNSSSTFFIILSSVLLGALIAICVCKYFDNKKEKQYLSEKLDRIEKQQLKQKRHAQ